MAKSAKSLNRNHVLQQDTSDCGVACLKAVLRFFGSDATFEILRNYSGTSKQGTGRSWDLCPRSEVKN